MRFILLTLSVFVSTSVWAQQDEIYVNDGAAIGGYDVVAYFNEGKPVKGTASVTVSYKGAKWLFASKENAEQFKANPEKYEPQYGGYCAYGCSRGYKAKTSPDAWTIVGGKLYLNYNTDVRTTWIKDQQNYIKKADENWTHIKPKKFD